MGRRTTFPRVSGGIVLDSFSLGSFFTGLLAVLPAGLLVLVGSIGGRSAGFAAFTVIVWYLTVLLVVARFAQLGILGETDAGLFSDVAGPWTGTALVALRLLALWIAWLLPIVVWGWLAAPGRAADGMAAAGMPGLGMTPFGVPMVPAFLLFWAALGGVLSFAFVSIAAAAPRFLDTFSPGLWGSLLAGRLGELFLAMAGTYGPPVAVFVVLFPLFLALLPVNPKATAALVVPVLLYLAGMVMTLQGRLAGAFSAAGLSDVLGEEEPALSAAPPETSASPRGDLHAPAAPGAGAAPPAAATAAPAVSHVDPRTLEAAWQANLAAGDQAGALHVASELIPTALAKGDARLAAQAYRRHLDHLPELGLDRSALDLVADQLLKDGDVAAAAWTFSQALDADAADPKAFKGLLRVADHYLEKAKTPQEAVRVYRYLLDRAPASPFAEHARDLLATAERRASRPAAQG